MARKVDPSADFPKCGTCYCYIRGNDTSGGCHARPPSFTTVYRVIRPSDPAEDDDEAEEAPRRTEGPRGKWPVVSAKSPGCPVHQRWQDYIEMRESEERQRESDRSCSTPSPSASPSPA